MTDSPKADEPELNNEETKADDNSTPKDEKEAGPAEQIISNVANSLFGQPNNEEEENKNEIDNAEKEENTNPVDKNEPEQSNEAAEEEEQNKEDSKFSESLSVSSKQSISSKDVTNKPEPRCFQ